MAPHGDVRGASFVGYAHTRVCGAEARLAVDQKACILRACEEIP